MKHHHEDENVLVTTCSTRIDSCIMTRKMASKYLSVGLSTLDSKLNIPYLKIGRSKRYRKADLDAFLLSCQKGGSNE